jgi:hypothetical protein
MLYIYTYILLEVAIVYWVVKVFEKFALLDNAQAITQEEADVSNNHLLKNSEFFRSDSDNVTGLFINCL